MSATLIARHSVPYSNVISSANLWYLKNFLPCTTL
jgi:hypothetical protein